MSRSRPARSAPSPPCRARSSTPPSPPSRSCRPPDQFRDIILKTAPDGAVVHLRDVARVELGADNYAINSLFNGMPAAGIAIMLAPGANALKTVDAVKARAERCAPICRPA